MDIFSTSFPDPQDVRVAALNDEFRETLLGGRVIYTGGVNGLGEEKVSAVLEKVRAFDAFTESNDPNGEHDFGAFDFDGQRFFWKIDYYDTKAEYRSPDPADATKTTARPHRDARRRVLTRRHSFISAN
jgi:hypothetical protein